MKQSPLPMKQPMLALRQQALPMKQQAVPKQPAPPVKQQPLPPCAGLPTRDLVLQVLGWQFIGMALLVVHIVLCKLNLLFFPIALLALGYVHHKSPLAGVLILFQWLIYQNWFISILSIGMDYEGFTALQGTNFAALVVMGAVSLLRLTSTRRWRHLNGHLLFMVKLALLAAAGYALYGMSKSGLTSAAVYFREATSLVLTIPIGLDVGRIWSFKTIGAAFVISAALSIMVSLLEIAAPAPYYDAINAPNYMNLKYTKIEPATGPRADANYFESGKQLADENRSVFFNVTGSNSNATSFKFMGTIIHPISYGYILAGVTIVAVAVGMSPWLWITLPMLAMIGTKGAALLVFFTFDLWFVWYVTRNSRFLLATGTVLMIAYVGFGILSGMRNDDYHVLGFLGGVHGLMADPIGHGLGVGGNFSPQAEQNFKWSTFQHSGLDFALESAVGVLIYQMGLASAAIFGVIVLLLKNAGLHLRSPRRQDIVFLALATVTVNGVFQEEAYTAYACGLFTLLCAVVVANGERAVVTCARPARKALSMLRPAAA